MNVSLYNVIKYFRSLNRFQSITFTILILINITVLMFYYNGTYYLQNPNHLIGHSDSGCHWVFSHYVSSAYEQEWLDGVHQYNWADDNICTTMNTEQHLTPSIEIIRRVRTLMSQSNVISTTDDIQSEQWNSADQYMSQMHYTYQCMDSTDSHRTGIQLIEPLWGYLRDPFDKYCDEFLNLDRQPLNAVRGVDVGMDIGQSKYHILNGLYAPYTIIQDGSNSANIDVTTLQWYYTGIPPWLLQSNTGKTIVMDLGSAYFSSWNNQIGHNAASGYWLYQHIHKRGAHWSQFYAYEHEILDASTEYRMIPTDITHTVHWMNVDVSADTSSSLHPFNILRHIAATGDYISVKLDIDTPEIELPLIQQLMSPQYNDIATLMSEFYFEHHVDIAPMRKWWGNHLPQSLGDSYDLFLQLRQVGIRSHSWP